MHTKTFLLSLFFTLSACTSTATQVPPINVPETLSPPTPTVVAPLAQDIILVEQPTLAATPPPVPTLAPDAWMEMPIVPQISKRTQEIYAKGQELGNRPDVFMKIGDSNSTTTWFLGPFARGEYSLGDEYAHLQPAIDTFQESFSRNSLSVRRGFTASSVLTTLWADPEQCESGETPLTCEARIMQPSFALVMLGSNDITRQEQFEPNMRKIIEELIALGIIPILSTKADNLEDDNSINATIAQLAVEYQIPLWNFWKAVQPLERHGAQPDDEAHLVWAGCRFDDPISMQTGWAWRNLTALQSIDQVWRDVR